MGAHRRWPTWGRGARQVDRSGQPAGPDSGSIATQAVQKPKSLARVRDEELGAFVRAISQPSRCCQRRGGRYRADNPGVHLASRAARSTSLSCHRWP